MLSHWLLLLSPEGVMPNAAPARLWNMGEVCTGPIALACILLPLRAGRRDTYCLLCTPGSPVLNLPFAAGLPKYP